MDLVSVSTVSDWAIYLNWAIICFASVKYFSSNVKKYKWASKLKWVKAFLSVYSLSAYSQKFEVSDLIFVSQFTVLLLLIYSKANYLFIKKPSSSQLSSNCKLGMKLQDFYIFLLSFHYNHSIWGDSMHTIQYTLLYALGWCLLQHPMEVQRINLPYFHNSVLP